MNRNFSPHKAYLCIGIVFGILMVVLIPPFQHQDEDGHFYRAFQVSTGVFTAVNQDQRLGGTIPRSLVNLHTEYRPFILNELNRISPKQLWKTRKIELEPNDTVFVDFTNTAIYPALLYLPQALSIYTGKQLGANPFWLLYIGRLTNLLIFIISVYYAIKIMPFKKWLFVLLPSLPMSIIVNSSLSADVIVNSVAFLMIAFIMNLAFDEKVQQISYKQILIILLLSVLIGMAKLVYVPLLFLLVLIPSKKFNSTKVKIGILAVAIVAGSGTAFIQKSLIDSKYIPYAEYNVNYRDNTILNKGCDIHKQTEFIKKNPAYTAKVFIRSFFNEFEFMARSYIGVFGWGRIYPPAWFVFIAYFIIFSTVIFCFNALPSPNLTLLQRCLTGFITLGLLLLIMLSQYLSFDVVGENHVYPLIGRYFIPVFPVFFIMLADIVKIKTDFSVQNFIHKGIFTFCIFSGVLTVYLILAESFTFNKYTFSKWEIKYSFVENLQDTNHVEYIFSDQDTVAAFFKPTGSFVTDERIFTGTHSLKLCDRNPYGFTLKIFKGKADDKLVVSCRGYGLGGYLNFQEYPDGINYWIYKIYPHKDSLGWKYQEAQFILPHDIPENHELRVFTWWPVTDSIYLDDFRVQYFEKK